MLKLEEKQEYKYTEEFGYIPEDWEVCSIKDISTIFGRIGFRGYTIDDIVKEHEGAISLSPSNIVDGNILYKQCTYISLFKYEESPEIKIYNGDVVLVKTGSTFGKSAIIKDLQEKATLNPQLIVFKRLKVNNVYFAYILKTKYFMNQIYSTIVGGAIPTLSQEQVYKFNVLLPPLPEQEKIAEVLSDIDELISSTQKLIDKKKDLKTATMQKLLTPKDNWSNNIIGDLGTTFTGLSGKTKEDFGTGNASYITFLNIMNNIAIDTTIFEKVNIKPAESQCLCKKNDIFFNTSSETPEEVGMCSVLTDDVDNLYLNSFCFGFRLKNADEINSLFLAYWFRSQAGRELMMKLAQGSTRYNLSKDNFMQSTIKLPKVEEQIKISQLLYGIDLELEALNRELNKYKDLKTGMMQELLTGKIRLINKQKEDTTTNVVQINKTNENQKANDEFKDAVLISMLAYKFATTKYPLSAFRRQKLSYLFKRHNNLGTNEYMKKAMGPYNSNMKYRGGEGIAIRNKYVRKIGERGLLAHSEISKAEAYFNKYYSQESLSWLEKNFHYTKNDELEVLATVDYAIVDLKQQNKEISLESIKSYINSDDEWKPKLQKAFFNDNAILKAMNTSKTLLNSY